MAFYAKDGSTWRQAKNVYVKDGSTWRTAKCIWVKDGSTWRGSWWFNGALTVGHQTPVPDTYGYLGAYGALSPTTSVNGSYTVSSLYYAASGYAGTPFLHLAIAGSMGSVTATNLIKNLYVVGGSSVATSAASFTNFTTSAVWEWSGDPLGFAAANGTTIQVQMTAA